MNRSKSTWTYILLAVLGALMLGNTLACDTVHGFGKDTEKAGDKIQDTADRNK